MGAFIFCIYYIDILMKLIVICSLYVIYMREDNDSNL